MSDNPFSTGFDDSDGGQSSGAPNSVVTNPYAPTTQGMAEPTPTSDVEAYRREYLNHEASVRSIGTLYLLGAIILVPVGLFLLFGTASLVDPNAINAPEETWVMMGAGLFYAAIGTLQGFTAIGLRRLQPWAKWVAVVFSAFGLLALPIGTIISGYFLYLLLSEKGRVVMSDEYKQVIAQTPHIKYKTSIIVWLFVGLLVALILLACGGAFLL